MSVKIIRHKFSQLNLHTDDITKEIEAHGLRTVRKAARHAAKIMRRNVSSKGVSTPHSFPGMRTGGLRRSVGFRIDKNDNTAFVGSKSPVVHLLEFGHGDGKTRNKRPFVAKSLDEAAPEVQRIMSEEYF